jgi:hypothetical protein
MTWGNVARKYGPYMFEEEILNKDFTYHPPKEDQRERYELIRATAKSFASLIFAMCPYSEEKSMALIKLDEVVFWANASIARNE